MGCIKETDSSDYFATSQCNPSTAQNNQDATGDPVNVVTGAFTLSEQDIAFPSQRLELEFTRHYNNQLHNADGKQDNDPLGPGWTHSLNLRLETGPRQDQKTYIDDHGSHITFDLDVGSHNYIPPPGSLGLSLTTLQDGTIELRQVDGVTAKFNDWGQILELRRPGPEADSRLNFQHDDKNRLLSVTGAGERAIYFQYDRDDTLIQAITDHMGRRWTYGYNSEGELVEVHDPAGRIRRYAYQTKNVLVTDADRDNRERKAVPSVKSRTIRAMEKVFRYFVEGDPEPLAEVTNQYTSDRRVHRQQDACGGVTLFDYNRFTRTTCVTDPAGWTTVYSYDEAGNTTKVRRPGGGISEFIYDDRRNLVAEIGPDGGRIEYVDLKESKRLECEQEFGRRALSNRSSYVTLTSADILVGYDESGNRPLQRDPLGSTTRYSEYTQFGRPGKVEWADGSTLYIEHDPRSGLPIRARQDYATASVPLRVRIREWSYDSWGNMTRLAEFTETAGELPCSKRIVAMEYDELGHDPISKRTWIETDGEGEAFAAEESYEWDYLGRLVASTTIRREKGNGEVQSSTTRFAYDALGRQVLLLDSRNTATCWELDIDGRTLESFSVEDFDSKSDKTVPVDRRIGRTQYSYDSLGRKTRQLEGSGAATYWEWDSRGFCTRIVEPSGRTTSSEYDRDGNEVLRCLATDYEIRFTYDLSGRRVSEEDPLGNVVYRKYDSIGRLVEASRAGSAPMVTRYHHDLLGRELRVEHPDESYERLVYDDRGNLTRRERGRRDEEPEHIDEFDHDDFGRLTGIKSGAPKSLAQLFTIKRFDSAREEHFTDAVENTTITLYDSEDNPIKKIDAEGRELYFEYEQGGRLCRRWSNDGSVESLYEYGPTHQLVRAQEGTVHYSWEHDRAGRIIKHEQRVGAHTEKLRFQYDDASRLISKNIGDDWWTKYYYKADSDNVSRIEIPNATIDLTTDVFGRVSKERWHDGGCTLYEYAADGTLAKLQSLNAQEELVFAQHLERDSRGRPIVETREDPNQKATYIYDYDCLDQLVTVSLLNGEDTSQLYCYEYDDQGNRLREFHEGILHSSFRYDRANRLLEQQNPDGLQTYAYDRCGNLIQKGDQGFTYDPAQRLRAIFPAQGFEPSIKFAYTATDERALIERDNDVEQIFYDGAQEAVSDSSKGTIHSFWGIQTDALVAQASNNQKTQRAFTDFVGSVIGIGELSEPNYYDPYGTPLKTSRNPMSVGFCGKRYEHKTGFYFNRARFYDPTIGRFTQPDPKGFIDGANLYLYARNNPINYSDQFGFKSTKSAQGRIANAYNRLQAPEPGLASLKDLKMVHYDAAGHKTGKTYFKEKTFWNPVPHLEHVNLKGEKTSETYLKRETFWNPIPHLAHYNMKGEKTSTTYFKESTFWNPVSHFEHFKVSGEMTGETYFKEETFWNPVAHFTHYDVKGHVTGTSYIQKLSWWGD